MWRSKKFIIVVLLAAVVLVGSIGGVVLAADNEDEDGSQHEVQYGALLNRVCEIYEENTGAAINPQELEGAFTQARSEMRDEALDSYLQKLVDSGEITRDEAAQHKEWWQSRPDTQLSRPFGCVGSRGFRSHIGHRFGGGPCLMPADANS